MSARSASNGNADIFLHKGVQTVFIMSFIKKTLSAAKNLKAKSIIVSLLGSAILAFGLYNVHSISSVTEGGVLGLTLLLHHWLSISPAISGFIMNAACYLLGWKTLGSEFIMYSVISSAGFSVCYKIFERICRSSTPRFNSRSFVRRLRSGTRRSCRCGFRRRRCAFNVLVAHHGLEDRDDISRVGPCRASCIAQLHTAQKNYLFPAHRHHLGSAHRNRVARQTPAFIREVREIT